MMEDSTLLCRYVRERAEDAFAELVGRHINLVYSAALRQVGGDAHAAEDVTQAVFTELAKAADKVARHPALVGWLYTTTRRMGARQVRSRQRQQRHEQEALAMQELLRNADEEQDWSHIQPVLDQAMHELSEKDRLAVLLRFFEGRDLHSVGTALGLSENAARMRVNRALDKLHGLLSKRGVRIGSSAALAALLAGQSVAAAPVGLALAVAGSAVSATAAASTAALGIFMLSTKLKIAMAAGLAAGITTTLVIQQRAIQRQRTELSGLLEQSGELERLRAEHAELAKVRLEAGEMARLRDQQRELLRLRSEVSGLRQQNRDLSASVAQKAPVSKKANPEGLPEGFVPAASWNEIGADTPANAFQSFLAVLKTGDPTRISSTVAWDIRWKDTEDPEEQKLMEKSKQDYLEMLQRAPSQMTGFHLNSMDDISSTRKRVSFSTVTSDGDMVGSQFEMALVDNQWKPVLRMGWMDAGGSKIFATSPVFGPQIDLPHHEQQQ